MTIANLEPHRDAATLAVFRWMNGDVRADLIEKGHAEATAGQLVDLVFGAIVASMAEDAASATPSQA